MSDTLRTLSVLVSAFFTGVGVTAVALGYLLGSFTVGSIGGALVLASLVLVLVASWYNRAQAEPKIDIEVDTTHPQYTRHHWVSIDTPIIPAEWRRGITAPQASTPEVGIPAIPEIDLERWEEYQNKMVWDHALHLCGCIVWIHVPVTALPPPAEWHLTPEAIAMHREVWATRCPKCRAL